MKKKSDLPDLDDLLTLEIDGIREPVMWRPEMKTALLKWRDAHLLAEIKHSQWLAQRLIAEIGYEHYKALDDAYRFGEELKKYPRKEDAL